MKSHLLLICLLSGVLSCTPRERPAHLLSTLQGNNVQAVIETPAGTNSMIKYNPKTALFEPTDQDIAYLPLPANKGFIPSTYWEDRGPLDIWVLSASLPSSTRLLARPIAVLNVRRRRPKLSACAGCSNRFYLANGRSQRLSGSFYCK